MPKVINLAKEAVEERKILEYLNSIPLTKAVKWSQEGRQKGHPDVLCCHNGLMILVEVKRPGEVQSLLQKVTMEEWTNVGTLTIVVDNVNHVIEVMQRILFEEAQLRQEGLI